MKRFGTVWLIFGLCVVLAAGAMARLGATAAALNAPRPGRPTGRTGRKSATGIWRMDSAWRR